jgi:hypothetical protein
MTHQTCATCNHVLLWNSATTLICPNANCPQPTTIDTAATPGVRP